MASPTPSRPPPRPIKRLLVANRGEIAARILSTASELSFQTYALHTASDTAHTYAADHSLELPTPESYLDNDLLISLIKQHNIDAVHPGYGFLSESAEFAERVWSEAGAVVVGPGWDVLAKTGDKVVARKLAESAGVPVLPALATPTGSVGEVKEFAGKVGYPVMIKAVDGGGGRGIRLVRDPKDVENAAKRAIEESPSKKVFVEKAAVNGYLHVEIQIVGDGNNVIHLYERQCSIQRRYQKVVEVAPCVSTDRGLVEKVIKSAVAMARKVSYFSLGTFEFLVSPASKEFFFLEVNPRLQVEHTLTESICGIDIVRAQLLLQQGASLSSAGLPSRLPDPLTPPGDYSIQLRVTAEDVSKDWRLSTGQITRVRMPCGNGIRVDAAVERGHVVGSSFDSLLAKIIVTGADWSVTVAKAQRALRETVIEGIVTNLNILRGIVSHPDFETKDCDTRWLEERQTELLQRGVDASRKMPKAIESTSATTLDTGTPSAVAAALAAGAPLFRKGDAWTIDLAPVNDKSATTNNHLQLTRILRNDFPTSLSAEIAFTSSSSSAPQTYLLSLSNTNASASAVTSQHRRGNTNDPRHIVIPFPGKLVEVCVDEGDVVKVDDVICVVQQMKMEIEIRVKRAGRVVWVMEVEDGEEVNEGILAAEIEIESARL